MDCPTLDQLPPPPPGKTGWPWTEGCHPVSTQIVDDADYPRISIVTPNYNYGNFLEETIRSVLLQGYPNLEYLVIDGGSTDNSVEIIKKYEPWLTYWVSEKDSGQASAVNKGLDLSTGIWFNWLNSDDIFMPNALKMLIDISQIAGHAQWITGARVDIDINGAMVDVCVPWKVNPIIIGFDMVIFPQDATFIRKSFLVENKVRLAEEFNNVFDNVLYFQLIQLSRPILTSAIFSAMRWHGDQKTLDRSQASQEYKTGILASIKQMPVLNRIIARLLITRFHPLVKAILCPFVSYGLTPASLAWEAVIFNHQACKFYKTSARSVLLNTTSAG
jgi:hypothetical protein